MVKGFIDFLGVNQYMSYYMYDPKQPKQNVTDYQMEWNARFMPFNFHLHNHIFFCLAYSVAQLPYDVMIYTIP